MSFEGNNVEIIQDNEGNPLFEIYSTGKALGYVTKAKGIIYPQKIRIDKIIENADIKPVVHGVQQYFTEYQLYDFMLEARTDKCKSFRKWITNDVLPAIRKSGGYIANSELMVNTYFGNLPIEQQTLVKGLFDNIIAQQTKIDTLITTNEVLTTDILSWADRPLVNAIIRRYASCACDGNFGYAWIEFKKELLYKYSININARITAYHNKTGKKTPPKTLDMITDDEVLSALKTIVSLCDTKKIDISDLLNKHKNENEISN